MKTHMVSLQCMSLKGLQTQMALQRNTMGRQIKFATPLELLWSSASYQCVSVLLLWCLGCLWRLLNFQDLTRRIIGLRDSNHNSHGSHINTQRPLLSQAIDLEGLGRIQAYHLFQIYESEFLLVRWLHSEVFGMGATALVCQELFQQKGHIPSKSYSCIPAAPPI